MRVAVVPATHVIYRGVKTKHTAPESAIILFFFFIFEKWRAESTDFRKKGSSSSTIPLRSLDPQPSSRAMRWYGCVYGASSTSLPPRIVDAVLWSSARIYGRARGREREWAIPWFMAAAMDDPSLPYAIRLSPYYSLHAFCHRIAPPMVAERERIYKVAMSGCVVLWSFSSFARCIAIHTDKRIIHEPHYYISRSFSDALFFCPSLSFACPTNYYLF